METYFLPWRVARGNREYSVEEIITKAIEAVLGKPVTWGRDDCCLWVADIAKGMIGVDPAAPWRGKYDSPEGAEKVMPLGLVNTVSGRFRELKWPRISIGRSQVGDIGIARHDRTPAAVVVKSHMEDWWIGRGDDGVTYVPPEHVICAWAIPCLR